MLWGEIIRIPLKEEHEGYDSGRISYRYSHDLKLVEVEGGFFQSKDGVVAYKFDEIILDLDEHLDEASGVHIPTPFHPGDLVKSISFCKSPVYGVVYGLQKEMDKEWWEWQDGVMEVRLDIYWEGKFGWENGVPILLLSYCEENEIPYDNCMIKLESYVRKGKLDIVDVLQAISFGGEPDDLFM